MNTTIWKVITYRYKESCLQQFTQAFITTCHIFFNKKERFFTSIWREKEAVPSGKPHGGMSSPTSKCCSDFYCHPAASQRRQGLPETWPRGYTIAKADPSVGSGWMWSRRRGGPTVAETLPCFREPCAGGGLSQLLPVLKRGDHLHKLLPGCSPACWQHRVGAAILCVSAQRDEEVVWGEVPGQIQKSLWEK